RWPCSRSRLWDRPGSAPSAAQREPCPAAGRSPWHPRTRAVTNVPRGRSLPDATRCRPTSVVILDLSSLRGSKSKIIALRDEHASLAGHWRRRHGPGGGLNDLRGRLGADVGGLLGDVFGGFEVAELEGGAVEEGGAEVLGVGDGDDDDGGGGAEDGSTLSP